MHAHAKRVPIVRSSEAMGASNGDGESGYGKPDKDEE